MTKETDLPCKVTPLLGSDGPSITDVASQARQLFTGNKFSMVAPIYGRNSFNDPSIVYKKLDGFVGLQDVKKQLASRFSAMRMQHIRTQFGLKSNKINPHMVFTGNPGTGKTSVARAVGDIYRHCHVLKSGHLVAMTPDELSASSRVGSEIKAMEEKIDQASGGVLLIDEAHNMTSQSATDIPYWHNAVNVLMKAMAAPPKAPFAVIMAGYDDGIQQMLHEEPGLKSRFQTFIQFKDYTNEELTEIFSRRAKDAQYNMASGSEQMILSTLKSMPNRLAKGFGNARFIERFFDTTVLCMADRVAKTSHPSPDDVMGITAFDISSAQQRLSPHSQKKKPELV